MYLGGDTTPGVIAKSVVNRVIDQKAHICFCVLREHHNVLYREPNGFEAGGTTECF